MERSVKNIIRKYGSQVRIISGEKIFLVKGFVRPLYYRNSTNAVLSRLPSGVFDKRHYYILLPPDVKLKKTGGETVECNGCKYTVNSNGTYTCDDKILYVWAVLTACTDPLEDDYDSSN